MPYALIFLLTSLLTFLIFTEIVTVNIYHNGNTVIDVNFMIFAVRYTKSNKAAKSKSKRNARRLIPATAIISCISRLIEKSYIDIFEFSLGQGGDSFSAIAFRNGVLSSFISAFIAFAKENSKKFTARNITISTSEHNNLKLNAKITVSLLNLIICTFPFFISVIGSAIKRLKGKSKIWRKIK